MTSLVPERMLVFSPALAATIGLEEAVLLYLLHDLSQAQLCSSLTPWFVVELETLKRLLPFWGQLELQRVSKSLVDKGVIYVDTAPLTDGSKLRFQFHSEVKTQSAIKTTNLSNTYTTKKTTVQPEQVAETPQPINRATLLSQDWQPQEDTLQWLAVMKNISHQFSLEQLEDFIFYWRERNKAEYGWDNKFRRHVIDRWQKDLQNSASREKRSTIIMDNSWRPDPDALQILERADINREFIEDAIPEFILYWREQSDYTGVWDKKFIDHIRRQWARYSNALEHDQEPRPISTSWQPSEDVYDILRMANIDIQFACELLPEFILFWRDTGAAQRSWNTKFLQYIKYQWATRHHMTGNYRAGYSLAIGASKQPPSSTFEQLTDRSWAAGIVSGT